MAPAAEPRSVASPQESRLPPGHGVARAQDTGVAAHELVYEHEYYLVPLRKLVEGSPPDDECNRVLQPAIRNGKVAFSFFGLRVPLSADHARCWFGHLLIKEMELGHLQRAEFIVPSHRGQSSPELAGQIAGFAQTSHGPQPSWVWQTWPADNGPVVTITMEFLPSDGICIHVESSDATARAQVYRVILQYCDELGSTAGGWHPIPTVPSKISKVHDRAMPVDYPRNRSSGRAAKAEESNGQLATRLLNDYRSHEARVLQALARVGATQFSASVEDLLLYLDEVKVSFEGCESIRLKLRAEWLEVTVHALETLLRRLLESGGKDELRKAVDLANLFLHRFGCQPPASMADAQKRLAG